MAALMLTACQGERSDKAGVSGRTVTSGVAQIGGPFTLVDTTGAVVTQDVLLGKPHLVYFGFAFCPDVCPTALSKLGAAQQLLGGAGDKVGYILVTVDPERDTPEKLGEYVTFDPFPTGLRGFTGTVEQIEAAKTAYIVYAQKVALEDSAADYTIDHADLIFLMGDDGKFVDFFTGRDTPQDIAMGVRQLLKKG